MLFYSINKIDYIFTRLYLNIPCILYIMSLTLDESNIHSLDDLVEGATIYHLAVENRDTATLLSAAEENLMKVDRDKETPLHYAAVNDDLEICKLLLSKAPHLKEMKCVEGKTALDWVIEYNEEYNSHVDIIAFLQEQ